MAEYSALKVADLKKLLTERKLSTAGNKPDLIARLEENDKEKAQPAASAAGTAVLLFLYYPYNLTFHAFLIFSSLSPPCDTLCRKQTDFKD